MMPYATTQAPRSAAHAAVDRGLVVALCVAALLAWLLVAIPSVQSARTGANQFQDDAFYYLVPAKHFLTQGRFTFDGASTTYGFHPLWMAATIATVTVAGTGAPPERLVFALNLVEKLIQGIAVALCIAWFLRERKEGPFALGYIGIALLLLCPYFIVFHQGMETTLAVLLYAAAVRALRSDRLVRLGLMLALLFLCRLDSGIFVGLPLAIYAAWSRRAQSGRAWAVAPLAIAMIAMPALYLTATGHHVPISGAIKSSFPAVTLHSSYFVEPFNIAAMYGWRTLLYGLNVWQCIVLTLLGLAGVAFAPVSSRDKRDLAMIAFTGAALVANLVLFQKWEKSVDPRYFALPMAAALFVFVAGVNGAAALAARPRFIARLPIMAVLVAFVLEAWVFATRFEVAAKAKDPTRDIYLELSNVLPPEAVVAGTDVGALAFWTGRRTINLDGVMNDFPYQDVLRDRKLAEYLRREGVTHIATPLWDAEQTYTARPTEPMYRHQVDADATHGRPYQCHWYYVHSYVYRVDSDRICLPASGEVYRRSVGRMGIGEAAFVVYELPRP
ncbi:MAG: hypothetical protein U1F54_18780 [Burkholderiales bacterium]